MIKISSIRTIAFRVNEEFHTTVKIQAAKEKMTLQGYIIGVLKKDIEEKARKEKNRMLLPFKSAAFYFTLIETLSMNIITYRI